LGYRKLQDLDYYQDDPLVKSLLGLRRLPDVSTVSRALRSVDQGAIDKVRALVGGILVTPFFEREMWGFISLSQVSIS
jgi:hypothetical protein